MRPHPAVWAMHRIVNGCVHFALTSHLHGPSVISCVYGVVARPCQCHLSSGKWSPTQGTQSYHAPHSPTTHPGCRAL